MTDTIRYKDASIYPPTGRRAFHRIRTADGRDLRAGTIEEAVGKIDALPASRSTCNTVAEVVADYLADLAASGSLGYFQRQENLCRNHIVPTIGGVTMAGWAPAASKRCLDTARKRLAPSTLESLGQCLRQVVNRAIALGWLDHQQLDPLWKVRYSAPRAKDRGAPEIDRATLPTTEDLDLLVKGYILTDQDNWALAIELVKGTGLRYGEVIGLRPCDIEPVPIIRVDTAIHEDRRTSRRWRGDPKWGRKRRVPYPASIDGRLRELSRTTEAARGPEGLLFVHDDPLRPISYRSFGRRWAKATIAAGWPLAKPASTAHRGQLPTPVWSVHDVRHYWACWMLFDVGAEIAQVSAWLGHAKTSFTYDRYVGVRGDLDRQGTDLMRDW